MRLPAHRNIPKVILQGVLLDSQFNFIEYAVTGYAPVNTHNKSSCFNGAWTLLSRNIYLYFCHGFIGTYIYVSWVCVGGHVQVKLSWMRMESANSCCSLCLEHLLSHLSVTVFFSSSKHQLHCPPPLTDLPELHHLVLPTLKAVITSDYLILFSPKSLLDVGLFIYLYIIFSRTRMYESQQVPEKVAHIESPGAGKVSNTHVE